MSQTLTINAKKRSDLGKGASRRLRHNDQVPAILYGGNEKPENLLFEAKEIRRVAEKESFYSQILTLNVETSTQSVILKDIQKHPAKGIVMHMDFMRITKDQLLTTHIPLHFINEDTCKGVKEQGGAITHARMELEIRCYPDNLPEFIEVDVSQLGLGEHIHASDLRLPEGVELLCLNHGNDVELVSVQATRATHESDNTEDKTAE